MYLFLIMEVLFPPPFLVKVQRVRQIPVVSQTLGRFFVLVQRANCDYTKDVHCVLCILLLTCNYNAICLRELSCHLFSRIVSNQSSVQLLNHLNSKSSRGLLSGKYFLPQHFLFPPFKIFHWLLSTWEKAVCVLFWKVFNMFGKLHDDLFVFLTSFYTLYLF